MLLSPAAIPNDHRRFTVSLVVPPGFGLASIILTGPDGTQPFVTTIGVSLADSGGDYVAVANKVLLSYQNAFREYVADNISIEKVSLLVGSDGGSGSVDSDGSQINGERDVDMAPVSMALIARKVTGQLGRSGRGRMFLPCMLADGDVNQSGRIEAASLGIFNGACQDFYDALIDDTDGMVLEPVLFHAENTDVPLPTSIISLQVAPLVGWIRGRIR